MIDLWEGDNRVELFDLRDGLHLGAGGNRKLCNALQGLIREKYPLIVPEDTTEGVSNMSMHFPHHSALTSVVGEAESLEVMTTWKW